jgi:DNA replication licensing factor MCM3
VAPSIYGHDELKKAVLLMLLGGEEKNLENGTHLRGDINLLMVGDPGTAKSQILRWVLSTAELAIGTTGSGASGVGLTAAIVADKDTGEKTLEAGAMVLADRGVVCIDEFDKMNEIDRVAVHEVMEQQTVTIAKAGMHCSLNARCSVIAAANPIYGEYQAQYAPTKNIGMPDSLLSRFDLVFIILDEKNVEKDKRIGERVCRNHRLAPKVNESYNQFNEDDEYIIHPNENQQTLKQDQQIYEKNNIYQSDSKSKEILTQGFLRRYITHCKTNVHPQLTDDAVDLLSHLWTLLRQADSKERTVTHNKVLPITIRSFETLIRLSTAHAKLHQFHEVKIKDCVEAFRLMIYCLEGDSNAKDDKLKEILKKLSLYDQAYFPNDKNAEEGPQKPHRGHRNAQKKEAQQQAAQQSGQKRMEEESAHGITHRMQRIDINKDEREAEDVIQRAVAASKPSPKEHKSIVFKALAEVKNKIRNENGSISYDDLRKHIPVGVLSN